MIRASKSSAKTNRRHRINKAGGNVTALKLEPKRNLFYRRGPRAGCAIVPTNPLICVTRLHKNGQSPDDLRCHSFSSKLLPNRSVGTWDEVWRSVRRRHVRLRT